MPTERLLLPTSAVEAAALLREHGPELLLLAGGTIAMGLVNDGVIFPAMAMSLHVAGLDGVRRVDGGVEVGATTTLTRLAAHGGFLLLAAAASQVGGWAVRNRATVGGNVFAAPPYGDVAVALLALDAEVVVSGAGGSRTVPLEHFYTGRLAYDLADDELVTAVRVPDGYGATAYLKFGRRQAAAPAVVAVAVNIIQNAAGVVTRARVALGAAGPHPLRAYGAEAALTGSPLDGTTIAAAAHAAMEGCEPPDDALASALYRRKMIGVFVRRALEQVMSAPERAGRTAQ